MRGIRYEQMNVKRCTCCRNTGTATTILQVRQLAAANIATTAEEVRAWEVKEVRNRDCQHVRCGKRPPGTHQLLPSPAAVTTASAGSPPYKARATDST